MTFSDQTLWTELKSGNRSALHRIYEGHVGFLYNYGKKFSLDSQSVEDCIHDLFVFIWMNRKRLGNTDNIRGYLALSLRRDILRFSNKSRLVDEVREDSSFSAISNIEDWIMQGELEEEQSTKLKSAYESLTNRQREIIYMRYHQNMDYEQIAEALGVKYQSLRNLLSAAIKGLRTSMTLSCMVIFFTIGCTSESEEAFVDQEFQIHFDTFAEEATKRGYPITDEFYQISAEFQTIDDASAQCLSSSGGERTIRVDEDYWNRISLTRREFVVYHELGHCYLGLSHDDSADPEGNCTTIMTSGLGGCRNVYSARTRETFLDQLFEL